MWAWRKTADSESGDYTITHNNAFANAVMLVYSGGAATIEDVVPSTNSGNADPNMLADSVTVLTPGSILIYVAAMWNVPADRPVMPGGVTPVFVERWNPHDSPTFPEGVFGLLVGDGVVVAGATGDKTATDGPDLDDWVTSLIVIRAEASSGGGALALYEEMMS
jgi:hypothetical protein